MQNVAQVIAFVGILIFLAHLFTGIFSRTRIPDVILLIIIGVCVGPVLGLASPPLFGAVGPVEPFGELPRRKGPDRVGPVVLVFLFLQTFLPARLAVDLFEPRLEGHHGYRELGRVLEEEDLLFRHVLQVGKPLFAGVNPSGPVHE